MQGSRTTKRSDLPADGIYFRYNGSRIFGAAIKSIVLMADGHDQMVPMLMYSPVHYGRTSVQLVHTKNHTATEELGEIRYEYFPTLLSETVLSSFSSSCATTADFTGQIQINALYTEVEKRLNDWFLSMWGRVGGTWQVSIRIDCSLQYTSVRF
jgi:hypothetical protein